MKIAVKSSAFENNGSIPKKYTCDGENMSPRLEWTDVKGAKSFAIICDDPDAPSKTWVHWVVYNIPADVKKLEESAPVEGKLGNGAMQGINDFGKSSYGGPCPPSGTHRYLFKVYALDTMLELKGNVTKDKLLEAMGGHIIEEGQLTGKYGKQ